MYVEKDVRLLGLVIRILDEKVKIARKGCSIHDSEKLIDLRDEAVQHILNHRIIREEDAKKLLDRMLDFFIIVR